MFQNAYTRHTPSNGTTTEQNKKKKVCTWDVLRVKFRSLGLGNRKQENSVESPSVQLQLLNLLISFADDSASLAKANKWRKGKPVLWTLRHVLGCSSSLHRMPESNKVTQPCTAGPPLFLSLLSLFHIRNSSIVSSPGPCNKCAHDRVFADTGQRILILVCSPWRCVEFWPVDLYKVLATNTKTHRP